MVVRYYYYLSVFNVNVGGYCLQVGDILRKNVSSQGTLNFGQERDQAAWVPWQKGHLGTVDGHLFAGGTQSIVNIWVSWDIQLRDGKVGSTSRWVLIWVWVCCGGVCVVAKKGAGWL